MTLFVYRTEHRDIEALHAKLDELLRTQGEARTDLTTLDERDVEDIVSAIGNWICKRIGVLGTGNNWARTFRDGRRLVGMTSRAEAAPIGKKHIL